MRYLLAVLLVLTPAPASAIRLNATLTASIHSWDGRDDGTAIAYNTIQQLVSLDVVGLGVRRLSFHAYGRGFVHTEGSEGRRRLALYSAYADWNRIGGVVDLRLGRQRILAGVGRGTVDGARAVLSLPRSVTLLAYAGLEAPGDRSADLRTWDEGHAYGVRASVRRWSTTLSLSYAEGHEPAGSPEANLDGSEPDSTARAGRLVGAEVRTTYLPRTDVYAGVEVNATRLEPARLRATGRYQAAPGLRLSASADHTRPIAGAGALSGDSGNEASTELEGAATYSLGSGLLLTESYSVVLLPEGGTHRLRLSLSRGRSIVSYYRRSGYGGRRDGLTLRGSTPILAHVALRGSLSFTSYGASQDPDRSEHELAGVLALDLEYPAKFAASLEGQVVENKTYDYDLRLFAKVTWWIGVGG